MQYDDVEAKSHLRRRHVFLHRHNEGINDPEWGWSVGVHVSLPDNPSGTNGSVIIEGEQIDAIIGKAVSVHAKVR